MARDGLAVLIASRLFPPEPGAAAFRLGWLAQALVCQGAQVTVLTSRPPRVARAGISDPAGVDVRRFPVLRDRGGNIRGYLQFASFDGPLLFRLLAVRRPAIVVVEPPPTTGLAVRLIASLRRLDYVYYAADVSSSAAAGMGMHPTIVRALRRLESMVMRGAARVLAVSEGVAREVEALGVPDYRVTVVGTGVDTTTFQPTPHVADSRPTLVYAGTMSEIHGAGVFIHAFGEVAREFPSARLVMLGQGTEREAMEGLAARVAPGQVNFEGLVGAARVAEALGQAWAGLASVRPGRGYDFSFPTKMFVSTACGTPVIYSGVGPGGAMVADHGLGWSTPWDARPVADAMRQALASKPDAGRRAMLAAWTREHASQEAVSARAAVSVLDAARAHRGAP